MWRELEGKYKIVLRVSTEPHNLTIHSLLGLVAVAAVAILFQVQKNSLRKSQAEWRSKKLLAGFSE